MSDFIRRHIEDSRKKPLNDLVDYVEGLLEENKRLKEQLTRYSKDTEMEELKYTIEEMRMRSIHIMSKLEVSDSDTFIDNHRESCNANSVFILAGTGMGMNVTMQCKGCLQKRDITDYGNW